MPIKDCTHCVTDDKRFTTFTFLSLWHKQRSHGNWMLSWGGPQDLPQIVPGLPIVLKRRLFNAVLACKIPIKCIHFAIKKPYKKFNFTILNLKNTALTYLARTLDKKVAIVLASSNIKLNIVPNSMDLFFKYRMRQKGNRKFQSAVLFIIYWTAFFANCQW